MAYMPPVLDQPSYSALHDPKRKVPRFAHLGQILMIGAALALAGFLAALITAILTYSAGWACALVAWSIPRPPTSGGRGWITSLTPQLRTVTSSAACWPRPGSASRPSSR